MDKLANGTEKTQRLTLRGRYGEVQRFFFDDINGADRSLDLSGDVLILAREDGVDLQITTQRRHVSYDGRTRDTGSATSRMHLRPTDTAAVELPKSSQEFEGHALSLRIQSREIRPADRPSVDVGVQMTRPFQRDTVLRIQEFAIRSLSSGRFGGL